MTLKDIVPQPPQSRKPRGFALRWTDMDIARMAQITKLDVANAKRWWARHSVPRYRNVLNSKKKEEGTDVDRP